MGLENRVAVITGATGGLGRVVAKRLAHIGARLALLSTNAQHLQQLGLELDLPPERYLTRAVDLTDPLAAHEAATAVLTKFGQADLLLHFVGGWIGGKPVTEVGAQEVAEMLDQHLWTSLYLAQAFVPAMLNNKRGRIVVISSPTASRPAARRAPYAIGKAAQEALMLTLADELRDTGVTANLLVVSTIDVRHERANARKPETPAWTTPEEIASMILYLCSDDARAVNGARIPMYGSP
jgi:NAD(P)-dependent dehydrogenase (short-subunit alcohol dehydrogenase family)